MNIPKALTEKVSVPAPSPPVSGEEPVTWITASEAAALLKVRPATILDRINRGVLAGKQSEDTPFTMDGNENYLVRLESLPAKAQYAYQVARLAEEKRFVSLDFASPRSAFGDVWIAQSINIGNLFREADEIRRKYRGTGNIVTELRKLAVSYGLSLSTLYRFSGQPQIKRTSLLYTDPVYLQDRLPKTMCLWSCDFVYALFLDKEKHYSQNDILSELDKLRDTVFCKDCPYHPDSPREGYDISVPVCGKNRETIAIPNNRRTLNRLLSHIPAQMILYCRKGYREWRAKYGLFALREKPLLVGECYQADNHLFDCFVRVKVYTWKSDKR